VKDSDKVKQNHSYKIACTLSESDSTLQNMHFATEISDRAYVIEKGHIRFHGTMRELAANEEVKQKYLMI
jgi:ABC-type branched-subunit amino acid transport system ATPase component